MIGNVRGRADAGFQGKCGQMRAVLETYAGSRGMHARMLTNRIRQLPMQLRIMEMLTDSRGRN